MGKRKIAYVCVSGHWADVMRHIAERENVETKVWVKEKYWRPRLAGCVSKFESFDEIERWKPDCVLFSYTGLEKEYRTLSAQFPCWNGNPDITLLETDRVHGLEVMASCGIEIPKTFAFKNLHEAIDFLKTNKQDRWYFKQSASDISGLTMGEREPGLLLKDIARAIDVKELPISTPCILQQHIDGDEIDFEAWCVNGEIIMPLNITLETKKAFAGDLGGTTGASAAVVWADSKDEPSEIAKLGILKMREWLRERKYNGQISLNSIVKDGHVYGLEFTCRFGINASFLLLPLLRGAWGDTFISAAMGELKEVPLLQNSVSSGVTFSVYPFPIELGDEKLQALVMKELCRLTYIDDIDGPIYKNENIFLGDAYARGKEILCAGTDGLLAFNAHASKTVSGSMHDALSDFKLFSTIPNIQYKSDGVARAYRTISSLANDDMLSAVPAL